MTPKEYKKLLEGHDWFFRYIDNDVTYQKGVQKEKVLKEEASKDEVLNKLYQEEFNKNFPKSIF
jgi:hypothetical protein